MAAARIVAPASEHSEQTAFVRWFRTAHPDTLIFAIPNGAHLAGNAGQRAAKMGMMKASGLVAGVPDLYVPSWRLWVEMKRVKGGRLSLEQEQMIERLRDIGDTVIVGRGWEHARAQVLDFLQAP